MKTLLATMLMLVFASAQAAEPAWKPEKGACYELYLCAGQSNMDGRAQAKALTGELANYAQPQTDVLIRYSVGGLRQPLRTSAGFVALCPGCSKSPATFGPELAFGRALADARKGKKILLIKVDEGGTNLFADWNPEAKNQLYARLIELTRETQEMLKQAGADSQLAGMIWLQGEGDSGKAQAGKYQERLTAFIARVRTDLKSEKLPFVIGQICAANPAYQTVIAAQQAVAKTVPATAIAASTGLKTSDKNVHFDAPSQIELGKRFAAEMQKLLEARN
jgi:iduronate 2-sulfatase